MFTGITTILILSLPSCQNPGLGSRDNYTVTFTMVNTTETVMVMSWTRHNFLDRWRWLVPTHRNGHGAAGLLTLTPGEHLPAIPGECAVSWALGLDSSRVSMKTGLPGEAGFPHWAGHDVDTEPRQRINKIRCFDDPYLPPRVKKCFYCPGTQHV